MRVDFYDERVFSMKRFEFVFFILFILLPFLLLNYGRWIDATEKPVKSDIIVCLGGGTYLRLIKSKELLDEGFSNRNIVLLLGEAGYNERYAEKNFPDLPRVVEERPKNTIEEIRFIKQYMKKHQYKSALIVTDPTHSRRVRLLCSLIPSGDVTQKFHIISSGVKWWNAECYWCNKRSRELVESETIRILYTLIFSGYLRYGTAGTQF